LVYKLTSTHEDSQLTAQVILVVLRILKYKYFEILCCVCRVIRLCVFWSDCVWSDQTVCVLIRLRVVWSDCVVWSVCGLIRLCLFWSDCVWSDQTVCVLISVWSDQTLCVLIRLRVVW